MVLAQEILEPFAEKHRAGVDDRRHLKRAQVPITPAGAQPFAAWICVYINRVAEQMLTESQGCDNHTKPQRRFCGAVAWVFF